MIVEIPTDRYLARSYNRVNYNCLHFARDVIYDATGIDIRNRLESAFRAPISRTITKDQVSSFKRLHKPKNLCLVLMQGACIEPHIGVYLRGRILHLAQDNGVQYQPVDVLAIFYSNIRYYEC